MRTYLLNLWDAARTSYWFVPSLLAASALALSFLLPMLDEAIYETDTELPQWILTTTDTARATLSAMAGAMIAVTGTVFSITIVTLSLTSQQFGPRLLRRFMVDLTTQITLGVFLSTGFYCLLLLRVVEDQESAIAAPHLSVLAAVVMAVVSMVMLITYIHHVAMLIQAPNVVAAVASDLDESIVRLFPDRIGESPDESGSTVKELKSQSDEYGDEDSGKSIDATCEGYIQAVAANSLLEFATANDLVIQLLLKPGDFVSHGVPLATVWASENDFDCEHVTQELNERIIVGVRRTPRQDVECAVEELVEVAVRALSPGINDPFTAINCIDRLGASLGRLASRQAPDAYRCDEDGKLRVIAQPEDFSGVLNTAFDQIRHYGQDSVAVILRLFDALLTIARQAQQERDLQSIKRHGQSLVRVAKDFPDERDQEAASERFTQLLAAIDKQR